MATHASILAWRMPWTEEPGRLRSIRSQRIGRHLATKQMTRKLRGSTGRKAGRLPGMGAGAPERKEEPWPHVLWSVGAGGPSSLVPGWWPASHTPCWVCLHRERKGRASGGKVSLTAEHVHLQSSWTQDRASSPRSSPPNKEPRDPPVISLSPGRFYRQA